MSDERPVVAIQSGDAFENRTRVLPLAIACQAAGWSPVVLVDDFGAAAMFARLGIASLPVSEAAEPPPSERTLDPGNICLLELRIRELGGRAFPDREWDAIRRRTLRLWWMLDGVAPKAIFVWNGFTGVWANALRAYKTARGLPGGFMERGPDAGDLFVDVEGVNGFASIARAVGGADRSGPADAADGTGARTSPGERILFVPLQVQADSNVLLHSPRIVRMRDLVGFALGLAGKLGEEWRVVVRPHPEEGPEAQLNLPRDPKLTVDAEHDLSHWIERADLCLTLNSNAGLQAALGGVPTICLGEGLYCRRGFVVAGQHCRLDEIAMAARRRLGSGPAVASAAGAFLEDLRATSLFWSGQPDEEAVSKLARFGVERIEGQAPAFAKAGSRQAPIARPGADHARMTDRLSQLSAASAPVVADFDFRTGDTLFLTYRRNRVPLTRETIETNARKAIGPHLSLNRVHRALDASGRVLIAHSRRTTPNASSYDVVLDEFGFPHARTYLQLS